MEGLSGMHYRTFAENIDEALGTAKAYAISLAKDPEENHAEREVTNVWLEADYDLVSQESIKRGEEHLTLLKREKLDHAEKGERGE